jgi:hypothetical protein
LMIMIIMLHGLFDVVHLFYIYWPHAIMEGFFVW